MMTSLPVDAMPATLAAAHATLVAEAHAVQALTGRIEPLARAVDLIISQPGKVILCGMGKSGLIARKIAATLCSTGTPSVFLHPAEAVHGDLGIYSPGDPTILLSNSGTTGEVVRLTPSLKRFDSPIIAMVGKTDSALARAADVTLDVGVEREADPLGIVPTSSATATLAMGHALACALMTARGFVEEDFAKLHPAGQLGRNLMTTVAEVMHQREAIATATEETSVRDVVIAMSQHPLGAACVLDGAGLLLGIITDGDLRRLLQAHDDIRGLCAADVMTRDPLRVHPGATLGQAAQLMEDRPSQISVLPVTSSDGNECLGLVRIQDRKSVV